MTLTRYLFCIALFSQLLGCAEPDFPAYNELDSMRVLAVRAEPPDLLPGSTSVLDAVIFDAGEPVSLSWSLCPWPSDPNHGFRCLVDQSLWEQAWTSSGLKDPPALRLGSADTAELRVPDDVTAVRKLCKEVLSRVGASASLPPDCDTRWNWTVRLTVSGREDTIEAVKDVPILLGADPERNANPVLGSLTIEREGEAMPAELPPLPVDTDVDLRLSIQAEQAELYTPPPAFTESAADLEPRRESLSFTWFVEGGETERIRSVFNAGVESLRSASHNVWRTPKAQARSALIVVVRDNRGGVGFVRSDVSLTK